MVAVAATLFAVNGTVSNVILGSGISSGQLTAVRCAGALIGLALIAIATRPASLRVRASDFPLLIALGIGLAVVQWAYFFAIRRLDIGIALLIQYIAPILVALWARLVFHEPIRRRIWTALALSLAGLTLIVEIWRGGRLSGPGIAATRAGITAMLEPVVAIVVAWVWLGESLRPVQLSGAALTLVGIGLVQTAR
jgi:drug/metabolite transporter (DMT)-like permease